MNLTRMEKKNSGDKYDSVGSLLKDAELIRANAYTFNSDPSDVEVRIMADMFLHYFRYLLRHALLQFGSKACDAAALSGDVTVSITVLVTIAITVTVCISVTVTVLISVTIRHVPVTTAVYYYLNRYHYHNHCHCHCHGHVDV